MTVTEKLEYLTERGIDAALGMRYADDSLEFYQELIGIFLEEYETKMPKVKEAARQPGKDYTVLVHGLKNNAKALGALELADVAYEHEKASKAGDTEWIVGNLPELLAAWERTVQIFKEMNN